MIQLAYVLVSVFASNNHLPPNQVQPDCRNVRGQIEARVDAIRATISGLRLKGGGSSAGDWDGPVHLVVLKRFGADLEITLRIVTDQGTVNARGKASATVHPTLPHAREVLSDLEVRGGSGAFNLVTGTLTAQGVADTQARTIHIDFAGAVCQAPQSQSDLVDTNPIAAR